MNVKASFHSGKLSVDRNGKENFSLCYSRANRSNQILSFIFEQSDWSMKQEVRNFLTQFDPPILISDIYDGKIKY
jgi:hypothetical protein